MTNYNTGADAANTAVRAYLTKVGEAYLKRTFNTASGKGKADWEHIRDVIFQKKCAYCNRSDVTLEIEHLIMFNRKEYGLHHPGNIVPSCKKCNKRGRDGEGEYFTWKEQLQEICNDSDAGSEYNSRKKKILEHMKNKKYPNLTNEEKHAIGVVASKLYNDIKGLVDGSIELYNTLDQAFVKDANKDI